MNKAGLTPGTPGGHQRDQVVNRGDVEELTHKEAKQRPPNGKVRVTFPVITNPQPKALVIHCADVRFKQAFRNFIETSAENCLGLQEEQYVSLVIPGGVSSLAEAMILPKQFKVAREQVEYLLDHFRTIDQVIMINHEDCGAYQSLVERIGGGFLKKFSSLLDQQKIDLQSVAKTVLGFDAFKASVKLYMAKFANAEHTQVDFEEISL